ncbi:M20/M25/M40 family metallo-hydrolase [Stieleria sp. TO1_6]|uniref:M20/M25/M40 family metallo-hydrolase n=1 Tax=Stieleria tagensis TaxID=2956795 RepID=UPI00209ACA76|nr:M20/M25/M40 family metallo-hydrolase [Stieleria tagensis]MCO8125572.1 M20/M25/M40 family metallo-hydrolase [Stieleria tagensis]
MKEIEVVPTEALDRYLKLTAIPGPSGKEKQVAQAIVDELIAAGLDPSQISYDGAESRTRLKGDCGNLIVQLPGSGSGPRTMLSAHMDTVPICVGSDPFVDGDQVHSRGATGLGADDRSGCAAILTAAITRLRAGDHQFPPAVIVFFIQEEVGLQGACHLDIAKIGSVDRAFNFDGGPLDKVTMGAIGGERMEIKLTGIPAHAGVAPENGASAIVMAAKAIAQLDATGWHGKVEQPIGVGTANVGVIQGGDATNVVTPEVNLRAEARSHTPAVRSRIVAEIRAAFENAAASVSNAAGKTGHCEFNSHVDYEAFELPSDDPSILALESALRSIGREPYQRLAGGGLDANWLNVHGIASVTVGCGQMNIHTADERLHIPDFQDACRIATMLICEPRR